MKENKLGTNGNEAIGLVSIAGTIGTGLISQFIPMVANLICDIHELASGSNVSDMKSNIIELPLICSNDMTMDFVTQYGKSIEVVYATMVRSILQTSTKSRLNGSAKSIFKSLPILTTFDTVSIDNNLNASISSLNAVFNADPGNTNTKGNNAVNAFLESIDMNLEELTMKVINDIGVGGVSILTTGGVLDANESAGYISGFSPEERGDEASGNNIFLQESRGGVPTWVDVEVQIRELGGKVTSKAVPIGVAVKPKLVDGSEIVSLFIKQNNKLFELSKVGAVLKKRLSIKSLLNKKVISKLTGVEPNVKKNLVSLLDAVSGAGNKPFVCILMSNSVKNNLMAAKVDVTSSGLLRSIYKKLPILSISIYDINLDTISYSLMQDPYMTATTSSNFNTDVSALQRTLSEGLRLNKMLTA